MSTCKHVVAFITPQPYRQDIKHDLSAPIAVHTPIIKDASSQEADNHFNSYVLRERETHGRRTVLKLAWEVYARKSAKNNNLQRLRNKSILINLPSAEQAELVMQTIERVVKSMDGKLLVKS
jgi:aromatic ring hydroxylase